MGKSTRRKFPPSTHRQMQPFTLFHVDLACPMKMRSIQGHYYHFIFVDDFTRRYKCFYFLTRKDEAFASFKAFHALISTFYSGTLRAVHSDRRGEFCSTEFSAYMTVKGVQHQLTAPRTPPQNGIAERANRTVAEVARAMLHAAGLSPAFWEFAVATAVHICNHAPSPVTGNVSPHKQLLKTEPDLSHLRVFGYLSYAHNIAQHTKYDPTSHKLVFVGYDNATKGYKLWDSTSHSTVVSTDVRFEETVFPPKPPKHPSQLTFVPDHPPAPAPPPIDLVVPDSDDEDDTHAAAPVRLPSEPPLPGPELSSSQLPHQHNRRSSPLFPPPLNPRHSRRILN